MPPVNRKYTSYYSLHINDHYSAFFGHKMIFVILYPAIDFKTSRIPTVKNCVSRSREDDFIPHPASNFLCIPHPASILSPIPHPAKPMLDPHVKAHWCCLSFQRRSIQRERHFSSSCKFVFHCAITPMADKKGESILSKGMSFILTITTGDVPVKSKLQHPPRATPRVFELLENFCSNSPLPRPKSSVFKCPIIGPFQVIKCPQPRETFR